MAWRAPEVLWPASKRVSTEQITRPCASLQSWPLLQAGDLDALGCRPAAKTDPLPLRCHSVGPGGHWQGNQFSSCFRATDVTEQASNKDPGASSSQPPGGETRGGQWPGEQEDDAALTEDVQDLGHKADVCDSMGGGSEQGRRALATGRLSREECCPPAGPPGWFRSQGSSRAALQATLAHSTP